MLKCTINLESWERDIAPQTAIVCIASQISKSENKGGLEGASEDKKKVQSNILIYFCK